MRLRSMILLFVIGAVVAGSPSAVLRAVGTSGPRRTQTTTIVLPHHVPQYRDGISLRFAMLHDVIHERFPKHGSAYYEARERAVRARLAALTSDDPARFPLLDDLAVGLDRQGKSDAAVDLMREKLDAQKDRGLQGRDLYSTHANLGTFLIHGNFKAAQAGDAAARDRFREGLANIHESIRVNPEAHFGRERWQAVIAEFLLASFDDPQLLTRFDFLGNGLATTPGRPSRGWGSAAYSVSDELPVPMQLALRSDESAESPETRPIADWIRSRITRVGAEEGWSRVDVPSHRRSVAFDEPMLGILGMWRQGGGANPHFAVAIGETMSRVGQRFIAHAAFERAIQLADRVHPDPEIRRRFVEACELRRRSLQVSIDVNQQILYDEFRDQLDVGLQFQKEYQEYEKARLAEGIEFDDPELFAGFSPTTPSIASSSGEEEVMSITRSDDPRPSLGRAVAGSAFFGGSISVLIGALAARTRTFVAGRRKVSAGVHWIEE
ncbi:MAG: hypothetical protein SFX72_00815 [Isosphaeraceae bacterium]|nr:hypothetical protein [Isosphaeraceae bacterium]